MKLDLYTNDYSNIEQVFIYNRQIKRLKEKVISGNG